MYMWCMNTKSTNPIRAARERAGLTRERAAVMAGVCVSTLFLAERAGLLSAATAAKLAPVLGVTPETLRPQGAA